MVFANYVGLNKKINEIVRGEAIEKVKERKNKKIELCPICNNNLMEIILYWCFNCEKWFEDIDLLDSGEEINEDCKKCEWLTETTFKKNNLTLFYCNSLKTNRRMEKIRDFRRCKEFNEYKEDDHEE